MADENVEGQTAAEDDPWGAAMAEQTQAEAEQKKGQMEDEQGIAAQPAAATVFKDLSSSDIQTNTPNDIDFILDIPVQLTVELGRTKIAIKNLLQLAQGSVVELDGMAGEPMDVLVNGCLIAQGEVVVVNDKFGIRLTDIITPAERIRKLNR
ncbi:MULTISPECIES: flagellar motor switch protein FliN [unclassified Herbaspirillum]|uniref:flagellar motor switch protein FliN n=1 Tax=unclassified Herbaspirillum TaxID=2624150 RepID=UPI001153D9D8|nr:MULTISPECIES: flagellar motor switch protein FliN [unclassified Herbaspirillum]MBB5392922.1 flagellar motor switch protein FliN/FliY [Herbaspirillum sp. SJZ102]TQK04432.1 flagellar motor switch protein FliN/FliY [Herbaspirillum sp. SJZ130]TQK09783.1 flagellar motor switch protein FliN/FliY [Herbaspirillum sp. SJZ106]TWC65867.1 flagellar motor switch protein FliN/FliY [Herbaspirillum sp. SJZ099]